MTGPTDLWDVADDLATALRELVGTVRDSDTYPPLQAARDALEAYDRASGVTVVADGAPPLPVVVPPNGSGEPGDFERLFGDVTADLQAP